MFRFFPVVEFISNSGEWAGNFYHEMELSFHTSLCIQANTAIIVLVNTAVICEKESMEVSYDTLAGYARC